jgi:hypothetical protein
MIKNIEELKDLITWAKEQGVRKIQIGDISFFLSNAALYKPVSNNLENQPDSSGNYDIKLNSTDPQGLPASSQEDDPDLFWSADS